MTDRTLELAAFVFDPLHVDQGEPVRVPEEGETGIIRTRNGSVRVVFGPRVETEPFEFIQALKPAPGSPDPDLIVGDWTGEVASREEREALAYREMLRRLRSLYVSLSKLRASWASSDRDCAAARAVAYQTSMARIGAIIEDVEKLAAAS